MYFCHTRAKYLTHLYICLAMIQRRAKPVITTNIYKIAVEQNIRHYNTRLYHYYYYEVFGVDI